MSYNNRFKNNNNFNQNPVDSSYNNNVQSSYNGINSQPMYNNAQPQQSSYNDMNPQPNYFNPQPQQSFGNGFAQPNDIKQPSLYNGINTSSNNSSSEFNINNIKKDYLSALGEGDFDVDSFLGKRNKSKSENLRT